MHCFIGVGDLFYEENDTPITYLEPEQIRSKGALELKTWSSPASFNRHFAVIASSSLNLSP